MIILQTTEEYVNITFDNYNQKLNEILFNLDYEQDIIKALEIVALSNYQNFLNKNKKYIGTPEYEEKIIDFLSYILEQIKNENLKIVYFSNNTIKQLYEIINKTDRFEYSANLCIYKNKPISEIFINYVRKGEKYKTLHLTDKTIDKCDKDKEIIGGFHTHINQKIIKPSFSDLMYLSWIPNERFECIGSKHSKEKLTCFVPKLLNKEEKNKRDDLLIEWRKTNEYIKGTTKVDFVEILKPENLILRKYQETILQLYYNQINVEKYRCVIIYQYNDKYAKNVMFIKNNTLNNIL